jgi:hypothetical protein
MLEENGFVEKDSYEFYIYEEFRDILHKKLVKEEESLHQSQTKASELEI